MRVAALYDIHGNLPALEAVLAEIRSLGVDQIIVGGDVALGPMPRECIDRLRAVDVPMHFVRGNCDREMLAALSGQESTALPESVREAIRWCAGQLRPQDEDLLGKWPLTARLAIPSLGEVLFCHATPRDDNEIFNQQTSEPKLAEIFQNADADVVICGHTHVQFERTLGTMRIVNAGSVGMPFDKAGAHWALLSEDVELRTTRYDTAAASARLRATSYPGAAQFAAQFVERTTR